MEFSQALVIALIPTLGVLAAFISTFRELSVKRRLESTSSFLEIAAVANGRPRDGRDHVGLSEQCAAIALLGEFGSSEKYLREPARASLAQTKQWADGGGGAAVKAEAGKVLKRLEDA